MIRTTAWRPQASRYDTRRPRSRTNHRSTAHIGNHLRPPLGVNMMGYAKNMPGSRVLDEGVDVVYFSGVVPKGSPGLLAYMTGFIEQAQASGLVKQAIEREGLRGVQLAVNMAPVAMGQLQT
jgi:hypothetical protein